MYMKTDEFGLEKIKRWIKGYLIAAAALLVFGIIYEIFSHGVYSVFMWGAFLIPFVFGAVLLASVKNRCSSHPEKSILPGDTLLQLWGCSVASLTAGSVVRGVLDIYGTTNSLTAVYAVLGALLSAACVSIYIAGMNAAKLRAR